MNEVLKNGTLVKIYNTSDKNLDDKIAKVCGIGANLYGTMFYILEFENGFLYNDYPCIELIDSCISVYQNQKEI